MAFAVLCTGSIACMRASPPAPGLESVADSEGLAIDIDGTVYFSQPAAMGRLTPAGKLDKEWAKLPGATKTWGIAIDRPSLALYIGSPTTATVYKVSMLTDSPTVTTFVADAGAPNGLTMGPDGALYYTDFQPAGDVYRVTADGTRTKVTTSPLPKPNGLAFGPDGVLYVDLFEQGAVTKLTLSGGRETARAEFVPAGTFDKADGLAFDAAGNAYIGWGEGVSRVSPEGRAQKLAKGRTANVEFGAGPIPAKDLYAVTEKKLVRITNDVEGAQVPWHVRPPAPRVDVPPTF